MTVRRVALCVPASEPAKVAKAAASRADEIIVDLEDAVALDHKDSARANLADLTPREAGAIAVRVNAADTSWFRADVAAAHANPAIASIVVPKAESAAQLTELDALLDELDARSPRPRALGVQVLIESAAGVVNAVAISRSSRRLEAMIIGYADLAASLGRLDSASWQFTRDTVLFAARAAGVQPIDGPWLSVADDEDFRDATGTAHRLGFDGKWVIHPGQIVTVLMAFTPSPESVEEARGILAAMDAARAAGRGAVEWQGRMLDEAIAVQARRTLSRQEQK